MSTVFQGILALAGVASSALFTLTLVTGPIVWASEAPEEYGPRIGMDWVEFDEDDAASEEGVLVEAEPVEQTTTWIEPGPRMARDFGPIHGDRKLYRICRVTAYHDIGTTAAGVPSGVGQCAGPGDLPFGTKIFIPALNKTLIVTDRTHKRFRNSTVDIFIPSRAECIQFGRHYLEVEITLPEGDGRRFVRELFGR